MQENKIDYPFIDINELKPYENNARLHPQEQINKIVNSIKEFGFITPVIIDENNTILVGHGRTQAAKAAGLTKVPYRRITNLTDEQKRAYILADNKLSDIAEWDEELLKIELENISLDMTAFGFEEFNIDIDEGDAEIIEDEVPEVPEEPKAKLGDIYKLGRHRLICGDCTNSKTLEILMGGQLADLVFTDPPYNVAMSRSKVDGSDNSIKNDDLSDVDYINLLNGAFNNATTFCRTKNMYWWIGFRQYSTLEKIFLDNNYKIANCIVWDKGSIGLGGKGYRYQHELCIFSGEINNNNASDVWHYKRAGEGLHPTMKPIELVANAITNISGVEKVLDVFGGSGSTLIACEQLNRSCYMCELDPRYIDVIIKRWEDFTGQKAELIKGGE